MELTKECHEEIDLAARELASGALTIVIQVRPEDKQAFDFKCVYEKRFRVGRTLPTETPGISLPRDKSQKSF
jgi:hypothetical protein